MWRKLFQPRAPFWMQAIAIGLSIFVGQAFYHRLVVPQPIWIDLCVYGVIGGVVSLALNAILAIWPSLEAPERRHESR